MLHVRVAAHRINRKPRDDRGAARGHRGLLPRRVGDGRGDPGRSPTLDFEIYRTNSSEYVRSHNTGIIDGHVYHNAGSHSSPADADAGFEYTSGHEFGHTILQEAGGTDFSWTHKGTTTLWQSKDDKTPSYPPPPDEIDMMLCYIERDPPSDFYARVHASNADILRLISLGEVELG